MIIFFLSFFIVEKHKVTQRLPAPSLSLCFVFAFPCPILSSFSGLSEELHRGPADVLCFAQVQGNRKIQSLLLTSHTGAPCLLDCTPQLRKQTMCCFCLAFFVLNLHLWNSLSRRFSGFTTRWRGCHLHLWDTAFWLCWGACHAEMLRRCTLTATS